MTRLHRSLAEALVQGSGASNYGPKAAEIVHHYRRSALLPGREHGIPWAIRAAEEAEAAFAWDLMVDYLQAAEELGAHDSERRRLVLMKLAIALPRSGDVGAVAVKTALEAADLARSELGHDEELQFIGSVVETLNHAGAIGAAFQLARRGLDSIGSLRDSRWAYLASWVVYELDLTHPLYPGMPVDSPLRREWTDVVNGLLDRHPGGVDRSPPGNRSSAPNGDDDPTAWSGPATHPGYLRSRVRRRRRYEVATATQIERSRDYERRGELDRAAESYALLARYLRARGDFEAARSAFLKAREMAERLQGAGSTALRLAAYSVNIRWSWTRGGRSQWRERGRS